jgi:hypothetical protein
MELFLHQDGEQVGPYTEDQIAEMLSEGSISREDLIWHEGLSEWKTISSVMDITTESEPVATAVRKAPAVLPATKKNSKVKVAIPRTVLLVAPAVLSLILGYFIGRWHVGYQIRSAFTDVAKSFSEGFTVDSNGSGDSSSEPTTLGSITSSPEPEPEPVPQLMVGQTYSTDTYSITLDSAKIATTKVKDMMGDIGTGKNPDLTFAFTFKNLDDRRILRFREGNQFLGGNFKLRDDVDNVIRGIDYGMMSKPVGVLTGSEDIAPGSSATHIELFSIPPPKTEHLILTVDLACLGGDGVIEFKIPAASISK